MKLAFKLSFKTMCAGQSSQWQYWEQLDLHFQSVTSEMDLNWSRWRKRGWDFVTDEKMFQSNRNLSEFNHKVERLRLLQSLPKKRFPVALHAPVAIKYHKNKSVGTDPGGGSNSSPRSNKILKQDRQRKQICLKKKKKTWLRKNTWIRQPVLSQSLEMSKGRF